MGGGDCRELRSEGERERARETCGGILQTPIICSAVHGSVFCEGGRQRERIHQSATGGSTAGAHPPPPPAPASFSLSLSHISFLPQPALPPSLAPSELGKAGFPPRMTFRWWQEEKRGFKDTDRGSDNRKASRGNTGEWWWWGGWGDSITLGQRSWETVGDAMRRRNRMRGSAAARL